MKLNQNANKDMNNQKLNSVSNTHQNNDKLVDRSKWDKADKTSYIVASTIFGDTDMGDAFAQVIHDIRNGGITKIDKSTSKKQPTNNNLPQKQSTRKMCLQKHNIKDSNIKFINGKLVVRAMSISEASNQRVILYII